jgi:hypothetical protein
MTIAVDLTAEGHGYTIRLVDRTYDKENKNVEVAKTLSHLLIENDRKVALAAFETLNTFISAAVEHKIVPKDAFEFKSIK